MREYPLTMPELAVIDTLEEEGLTVAQIAQHLSRSRRSVGYYLHHRESHCEEEADQPALGLHSARTYGG